MTAGVRALFGIGRENARHRKVERRLQDPLWDPLEGEALSVPLCHITDCEKPATHVKLWLDPPAVRGGLRYAYRCQGHFRQADHMLPYAGQAAELLVLGAVGRDCGQVCGGNTVSVPKPCPLCGRMIRTQRVQGTEVPCSHKCEHGKRCAGHDAHRMGYKFCCGIGILEAALGRKSLLPKLAREIKAYLDDRENPGAMT